MPALLRIVSTALITAGLLLIANVGLTLAWKEPVSSLLAALDQRGARAALADDRERLGLAEPDPVAVRRAARAFQGDLRRGDAFGRLEAPEAGIDSVVVRGTDTGSLREGPGHYEETTVPGLPGTVAIAGHRTTWGAPFRRLDDLSEGDPIVLDMPYARFLYRVVRTEVVAPDRTEVIRDTRRDRLVLTACHPLYSAAERLVVTADLDSVTALPGVEDGS